MNGDIPSVESHEEILKGHHDVMVNYGERIRTLEALVEFLKDHIKAIEMLVLSK